MIGNIRLGKGSTKLRSLSRPDDARLYALMVNMTYSNHVPGWPTSGDLGILCRAAPGTWHAYLGMMETFEIKYIREL